MPAAPSAERYTARLTPTTRRRSAPPETYLFSAIAIIALIAYTVATPGVPALVQASVIAVLVAVLGLPHGALDPMIARRLGLWRGPGSLLLFSLGYAAISGLVIAFWLVSPVVSLIGFLVISALHFGGDWKVGDPLVMRLFAGTALLSLPAMRSVDEVATLYVLLSGSAAASIAAVQSAAGPLLLLGLLATATAAARRRPHEGVELLLAASLALVTPPLVFFAIYFCLLHSARHLREGFASDQRVLSRSRTMAIVAGATIIPIVVAVALLPIGAPDALGQRLIQIVFIGLAALTVPHMALMALDVHRHRTSRALR